MFRVTTATALLGAVAAIAACGGDDSSTSQSPQAGASAGKAGGLVTAEPTAGFTGPAGRSRPGSDSVVGGTSPISPKANRKTRAQRNGVASGAACNDSAMTPTVETLAQANAAIACLVNGERADRGLPALAPNAQLQRAAEGMAARMIEERFFAHDTPDGKTLVDRIEPTGYLPRSDEWVVGENLAWGSGGLSTPQSIVNGWMNSPGHRANILAPDYRDIGLAAAMGSPLDNQQGGTVYVNNFGARSGANADVALTSATKPAAAKQATKKTTTKKKKKKRKRKRARRRST